MINILSSRIKTSRRLIRATVPLAVFCASSSAFGQTFCNQVFAQIEEQNLKPIETLVKQAQQFEKLFQTSGFQNLAVLEATLLKYERTRATAEILKEERFEVAVRRPVAARASFLSRGLTNLHESGQSMASRAQEHRDEYLEMRSNAEATYLGVDRNTYKNAPAETKAIYGFIRLSPLNSTAKKDANLASDFGDDIYIWKNEEIRDSTLFFMGDSLDVLKYRFDAREVQFSNFTIDQWDQNLIPWKDRLLLAVESHGYVASAGTFALAQVVPPQAFAKYLNDKGVPDLVSYRRSVVSIGGQAVYYNGAPYIEAQIFRRPHERLGIEKLKAFEFRKNPPAGAFLAALESRGVKIIDGRNWPAKEWSPPAAKAITEKVDLKQPTKVLSKKVRLIFKDGSKAEGDLIKVTDQGKFGTIIEIQTESGSMRVRSTELVGTEKL